MVKSTLSKSKIVIIICLSIILFIVSFCLVQHFRKKSIALRAVNDMYTFVSYDSLAQNNMPDLQKICTKEVYDKLALQNTDRALTTYLKFKNEPVKVNIIKTTDEYIIYSLETDAITRTRKFVFFYNVNLLGKINDVSEAELYDFYTNDN